MTGVTQTVPNGHDPTPGGPVPETSTSGGNRLRGARVEIDGRRVARVAAAACLVGLAALSAVLFVVGFQKNAQIARLHNEGVPVTITVSGCLGLLGGSGSNAAGYECRGSYTLDGRPFNEPIPGNAMYDPGTKLHGVAVPGDPALVTTAAILRTEHVSGRVFVLPSILLALLVLTLGAFAARRRRSARRQGGATGP